MRFDHRAFALEQVAEGNVRVGEPGESDWILSGEPLSWQRRAGFARACDTLFDQDMIVILPTREVEITDLGGRELVYRKRSR